MLHFCHLVHSAKLQNPFSMFSRNLTLEIFWRRIPHKKPRHKIVWWVGNPFKMRDILILIWRDWNVKQKGSLVWKWKLKLFFVLRWWRICTKWNYLSKLRNSVTTASNEKCWACNLRYLWKRCLHQFEKIWRL